MFSHLMVGITDFDRALSFYRPLMQALGLPERFCNPAEHWAGWQPPGGGRPLFVMGRPFDGQPHLPGNGQMVSFLAATREQVRVVHAVALAQGGQCEGPPGLRPQYHADYYGAYFRDLDGNKLAVACHAAESEAGL
jgi:catechol 2,3-dioxygenase-like lactoylglutathione lyase family enzyme